MILQTGGHGIQASSASWLGMRHLQLTIGLEWPCDGVSCLHFDDLGPAPLRPGLRSVNVNVFVNMNEINTYLQAAREIIGERSPGEVEYDNAVVANLSAGMSIRKAVAAANRQYPEEALKPGPEHWDDLAVRYDYIREHKAILRKLGMSET
jgi:hypothetical protein